MSASCFEMPQGLWDEFASQFNKILLSISKTTTQLLVHPASFNTSKAALTGAMSSPMCSLQETGPQNIALIVPSFESKVPPQAVLFSNFTPLPRKTGQRSSEKLIVASENKQLE
ncbi:hypothetical protein V6N13_053751 [Hibiscus sabdariffa]